MFGLMDVWVSGNVIPSMQRNFDRRIQAKQNKAFKWVTKMRELWIVTYEYIVTCIEVLTSLGPFYLHTDSTNGHISLVWYCIVYGILNLDISLRVDMNRNESRLMDVEKAEFQRPLLWLRMELWIICQLSTWSLLMTYFYQVIVRNSSPSILLPLLLDELSLLALSHT